MMTDSSGGLSMSHVTSPDYLLETVTSVTSVSGDHVPDVTKQSQLKCVTVEDHQQNLNSVNLAVGCHDTNLLSSIFHDSTCGDTLMVDLSDSDGIYSVYNPSFTQYVPDIAVSVAAVPDLSSVFAPLPDTDQVSTVTLTLPDPVVTSDQERLQVLSRTWTPELAVYLSSGQYCDTVIACADGHQVSAHKLMLAAASPVLASCLSDAEEAENTSIIAPDFTDTEVQEFLEIIYLNSDDVAIEDCSLYRHLSHNIQEPVQTYDLIKYEEKIKKLAVEVKIEANSENKEFKKKCREESSPPNFSDNKLCCKECGKTFKKAKILREHMKIHGDPQHKCDYEGCDKKFHLKANLKAHIDVVHLKVKSVECDVCGKQFYNQSQLKAHMQRHDTDSHICEHCSHQFSCDKTLKEHIKLKHSGDSSVLKCTVCHKGFSTKQNLKSHFSRIHMQEKKFICSECGKSFFEKSQLEVHQSSHSSEEQNYQCDVCKLKFKSKKTLYYHKKRTHNPGNKIHICYQCGKSYADSHHLNRHLETHGQKSCLCKICGKAFQSEEKVKGHIRKVHEKWRKRNDVQIMCALCDRHLANFTSLKRHLKDVHKLNNIEANSVLVEKYKLDPKKHKMDPTEIIPELLPS